jgi:hypothetical protein
LKHFKGGWVIADWNSEGFGVGTLLPAISSEETEHGLRVLRITAPAFPELIAHADDEHDVRRVGGAAIQDAINTRQASGEPIPPPLTKQGTRGTYVEVIGLSTSDRSAKRIR